MGELSVSVDELRQAASKVRETVGDTGASTELPTVAVAGQGDLNVALVEFVGCMNDCTSERQRAVEAVATGLREVADLFENMDAGAQADLRALGSVEGWIVP